MKIINRFTIDNTSKNRTFILEKYGNGLYFEHDTYIDFIVINELYMWQTYSSIHTHSKVCDITEIAKYIRKEKLEKICLNQEIK